MSFLDLLDYPIAYLYWFIPAGADGTFFDIVSPLMVFMFGSMVKNWGTLCNGMMGTMFSSSPNLKSTASTTVQSAYGAMTGALQKAAEKVGDKVADKYEQYKQKRAQIAAEKKEEYALRANAQDKGKEYRGIENKHREDAQKYGDMHSKYAAKIEDKHQALKDLEHEKRSTDAANPELDKKIAAIHKDLADLQGKAKVFEDMARLSNLQAARARDHAVLMEELSKPSTSKEEALAKREKAEELYRSAIAECKYKGKQASKSRVEA
jgi:chromosome segregation ATPase